LTYSPQSPRACALQMPNRPPEKTFITSCRPQDSPVVHKTLCHAQNKAHPNAQSSPSRTPLDFTQTVAAHPLAATSRQHGAFIIARFP
jgi:hypothetical protein